VASVRKSILVVEDEPLLRMAAVDLVEEAGYDVAEATDAAQAIAILQGRADIALVFTDIDMPGYMDGIMLAAFIRECWPHIQTILTSGKFATAPGSLPSDSLFFTKPYRDSDLVEAFRKMTA
jgi:CheY-like chemotaxis protein